MGLPGYVCTACRARSTLGKEVVFVRGDTGRQVANLPVLDADMHVDVRGVGRPAVPQRSPGGRFHWEGIIDVRQR